MGLLVGIDFGTCNIKVSRLNKRKGKKEVKAIQLSKKQGDSDKITPNIIEYRKDEKIIGILSSDTDNAIKYIKRKLELENWSQYIKSINKEVTGVEVATDIFSWINKRIKEQNADEEIEYAIITTPVCYSEIQKDRIKKAAINSGINVKEVISEPLAAMFSMDEILEDEESIVMIFDFGGGTLDVSLFEVLNDGEGEIQITVLASKGLRYGGVDINNSIYNEIILKKYEKDIKKEFEIVEKNTQISDEEAREKYVREKVEKDIMNSVEALKQSLFSEEDDDEAEELWLSSSGKSIRLSLKKDEVLNIFENIKIKEKIEDLLEDLIDEAKIDKEDITSVKLIGGTSRIDYFRKAIFEYFDENEDVLDLDEIDDEENYRAVANGAAIYAGFLSEADSSIELKNKIAFNIGIDDNGKFKKVISRNSKYGFISPKKYIDMEVLKENKYKVKIYQVFGDNLGAKINENNEVIYIGYLKIDPKKYKNKDGVLMEVQIGRKGEIIGRFYEKNELDEVELIEEKNVVMED